MVCSGRNRPHWSDGQWGHAESAAFVGGGDEPEQQLGAGVVERGESYFVDQDEVVAEQVLDHAADGVVGQAAVEGLGQVGGGEVPDLAPSVDGVDAERDQDMAFAVPACPPGKILPGGDPFQGREVVQGRAGDGARGPVQLIEGLDDGERGGGDRVRAWWAGPGGASSRATAVAGVRVIACGNPYQRSRQRDEADASVPGELARYFE